MTAIRDGFGRGIFAIPFEGRISYGHRGGIDNFVSVLSYFPDDSVAIAICSNGLDYGFNELRVGTLRILYNEPYEIPTLGEALVIRSQ
jgi:hypothetical protein